MELRDFISSKVHNGLFGSKPSPLLLNVNKSPIEDGVHIFEIRGTNGSGKSTLPFMAQSMDIDASVASSIIDQQKVSVLVSPALDTVFVGRYPFKKGVVGGVDSVSGGELIQAHILFALRVAQSLGMGRVFFEGIMTSTSNSRYTKLLKNSGVPDSNIHVGWCNTPVEVCIERVFARSGKDFNHKLVEGKFSQLKNQLESHKELFPEVNRFVYDCMCTKEQMLNNWAELSFEQLQ